MKSRFALFSLLALFALPRSFAQTDTVFIPFGTNHYASTNWQWMTNASVPDHITNWMAWQAADSNFFFLRSLATAQTNSAITTNLPFLSGAGVTNTLLITNGVIRGIQ